MPKRANEWESIKAEYLMGGTSYRKLAQAHGVPLDTLEKRAKREGWRKARETVKAQVADKLPTVVAAVKLDAATEWVAEMLNIAILLRERLAMDLAPEAVKQLWMRTMKGPELLALPKLNDTKDVKTLIEALAKLDEIGRRALGLDDDKSETQLDQDWDAALDEVEQRQDLAAS